MRGLEVVGVSCIVMAVLLAIAELYCRHRRMLADMTLLDALVVGIAQIGALIPGVSRSGSTLTAALFLDLKREEAARFSFLLGIPAIALAGLKEIYELHKSSPRPAGLVGSRGRTRGRLHLGLCRDLSLLIAYPRTVLDLALRDLSGRDRHPPCSTVPATGWLV